MPAEILCYSNAMAITTEPDIHELVICANVFIRRDGKYLVLRRSPLKRFAPDVVHPVGGKVDLGEDPFTSAMREVLEETGLTVKNVKLEAVINELAPPPDHTNNWLIFHFSADYAGGEQATTDEGELVWLTAEQIKQEKLFQSVVPLIDKILDPAVGTVFATFKYNDQDEIGEDGQVVNICAA
jgi:8-oxo-dGTP diphosphatase